MESKILTHEQLRQQVLRAVSEGPGVVGPSLALLGHDEALRELVRELAHKASAPLFYADATGRARCVECQWPFAPTAPVITAHRDDCSLGKLLARAKECLR